MTVVAFYQRLLPFVCTARSYVIYLHLNRACVLINQLYPGKYHAVDYSPAIIVP
jgi:hypothetical protein